MPAQTTNLFLLEDLEDVGRTSELAESDLAALHAVADWDQDLRGQAAQGSRPTDGDDASYNVIVVVFSDLPAGHARGIFDDVIQQLAVPSYVEDGVLFGPYYEGNEATAIYNSSFRPFQSPVPFLFVRHGVTGDWKFFLDDEEWLNLWARRYGESAVHALAEELRGLPWRMGRDSFHLAQEASQAFTEAGVNVDSY